MSIPLNYLYEKDLVSDKEYQNFTVLADVKSKLFYQVTISAAEAQVFVETAPSDQIIYQFQQYLIHHHDVQDIKNIFLQTLQSRVNEDKYSDDQILLQKFFANMDMTAISDSIRGEVDNLVKRK